MDLIDVAALFHITLALSVGVYTFKIHKRFTYLFPLSLALLATGIADIFNFIYVKNGNVNVPIFNFYQVAELVCYLEMLRTFTGTQRFQLIYRILFYAVVIGLPFTIFDLKDLRVMIFIYSVEIAGIFYFLHLMFKTNLWYSLFKYHFLNIAAMLGYVLGVYVLFVSDYFFLQGHQANISFIEEVNITFLLSRSIIVFFSTWNLNKQRS